MNIFSTLAGSPGGIILLIAKNQLKMKHQKN